MATETEKLYNAQAGTATSPAAATSTPSSTAYDSTQPVRSTAPSSYTPTGVNDPANLQQFNQQNEQKLNTMYDANRDSALAQLKTAYDQNLSNEQAAMDKIAPQYQESANQLGADYERQRRNNNLQAQANGLNTGANSQMQLAASNAYQAGQASLQKAQNQALQDAQRRITDLQNKYQNDIAAAIADNDAQRAAALYNEYQNAYKRQVDIENTNYQRNVQAEQQAYERAFQEEQRDYSRQFNEDAKNYERQQSQATQLAQYGDFSGFRSLYGEEVANQMERTWLLNNPALAYTLGKISADEYFRMTGKMPPGTAVAEEASSGGGRGYGYGYGGSGGGQEAYDNVITSDMVKEARAAGMTDEQIRQAAEAAGATVTVRTMADSYDRNTTPKAYKMSTIAAPYEANKPTPQALPATSTTNPPYYYNPKKGGVL